MAVVAEYQPCAAGDAAVPDARRQLLDNGWKFSLGESSNAVAAAFDDTAWRTVDLPHDWSIEGKRDTKAPMGGEGGYFPAGIGWYRRSFDAPRPWEDKRVGIEFDGV